MHFILSMTRPRSDGRKGAPEEARGAQQHTTEAALNELKLGEGA